MGGEGRQTAVLLDPTGKGTCGSDDGNLNPQWRIGNVAPDLNYWIFLWLNLISQQNFPFFFLIIAWFR